MMSSLQRIFTFALLLWCQALATIAKLQYADYWVRPETVMECPDNSTCFTLSELMSGGSLCFERASIIHFLPGTHTSNTTGWLHFGEQFTDISIIGETEYCSSKTECSVTIDCTEAKIGFAFTSLVAVRMERIHISHCGSNPHHLRDFRVLHHSAELVPDCRYDVDSVASVLIANVSQVHLSGLALNRSSGYGLLIMPFKSVHNNMIEKVILYVLIQNSTIIRSNWNGQENTIGGNIAIMLHFRKLQTFEGRGIIHLNIRNVNSSHGKGSKCLMNTSTSEGSSSSPHYRQTGGGLTVSSPYEIGGFINISDSCFSNNKADFGGGIYLHLSLPIPSQKFGLTRDKLATVISNSQINHNKALVGGGIYIQHLFNPNTLNQIPKSNKYFILKHSNIHDNQAEKYGGGLYFWTLLNPVEYLKNVRLQSLGFAIQYVVEEECKFYSNQAVSGAAIHVLVTSKNIQLRNVQFPFVIVVTIDGAQFLDNSGSRVGAVHVESTDINLSSGTILIGQVRHCLFSGNTGVKCAALCVENTSLRNQSSRLLVENSTFVHNHLPNHYVLSRHDRGTSIYIRQLRMILINSIIANNTLRGVYVHKSAIYVKKVAWIVNNSATSISSYGGGIFLDNNSRSSTQKWSQIVVEKNSTLYLIGNKATGYGGAIATSFSTNTGIPCFFSYRSLDRKPPEIPAIVTMGNVAGKAGNAIFGGALETCIVGGKMSLTKDYFMSFFSILENNTQFAISSVPYKLCICENSSHSLDKCVPRHTTSVYPGKTFHIPLIGVGQWNYSAPSVIRARITSGNADIESDLTTQDIGLTCRQVPYIVHTQLQNHLVNMSLVIETAYLQNPLSPTVEITSVELKILECPFGFTVSNTSGTCQCTNYLNKLGLYCDIETQTILKHQKSWIGNYSRSEDMIIYNHCPFDYCKGDYLNIDPYDQQDQCNFNRTGVLCGACRPGHSLALGTSRCMNACSNVYLLLLIPFSLAGVLLVVLLLKCNFSVSTGTINGLILYSNIIHENRSIFFPPGSQSTTAYILSIFIAWLNLDLGIETCFSENLNALTRTWLQFAFPLYIWLIVGILILVSRHSTRVTRLTGSNTVSVLATLLLLSYTKLLRTTFNSFYPAQFTSSNGSKYRVWYVDGNVNFLERPHSLLFTAAFLMLATYIIPFALLLLLSPLLLRYSHFKVLFWVVRIMPLLDAYHGPYKIKYRNWTGLMLLFRLALFIAFSSNIFGDPAVDLVVIIVGLSLLLTTWIKIGRVYKKAWINASELFFLINLLILTALSLYFRGAVSTNHAHIVAVSILVGSALIFSGGIVAYHIAQLLNKRNAIKKLIQKTLSLLSRDASNTMRGASLTDFTPQHRAQPKVTHTVIELTESLLENKEQ